MKLLKDMTEDERFRAWADHMVGGKINAELEADGVGLAVHKLHLLEPRTKQESVYHLFRRHIVCNLGYHIINSTIKGTSANCCKYCSRCWE